MLSVNNISERSLETEAHSPCLHWLVGKDNGSYFTSRLLSGDSPAEENEGSGLTKVEVAIMTEVTEWLQSRQCDEFWTPRRKHPQKVSYSAA